MIKPLSEMTLAELWELFPIILKEHNPLYGDWYAEESARLVQTLGRQNIRRISHIGSTAVAGLIAKPTVDILLEVSAECDSEKTNRMLCESGWIVMRPFTGDRIDACYNKGYTSQGFAERVFHLHVRRAGDPDELYFRDYLIAHKDAADAYGELKCSLLRQYEHDRDGYTDAKTELVRRYTRAAREEFPCRYRLGDLEA